MIRETLEDVGYRMSLEEGWELKICAKCAKHLEFPNTFCSGCGMYIKNCFCLEESKKK